MSNIHGLGNVKKSEKKDNEEEYSMGGATSATAVWRPNNSAARDPIPDLIQRAKEQKDNTGAQDRNIGLITLYANGFIIGSQDNEFRDIKDPKNKKFMDVLRQGEVPEELEPICLKEWGARAETVSVNLVDRSTETFTPPKPKFDFATSKGQSLGGASSSSSGTSFAHATATKVNVDASQPTTKLQIVLSDRKKVNETFNQSHTVLQLYQHIMAVSGQPKFDLVAGFPPKPLADPSQTLKEAGLLGASVQQRL